MRTASGFFRVAALCAALVLGQAGSAAAQCVDISDMPLSTRVRPAPPNIMYVLDNSGSMDWEIMTGEEDGLFRVGSTMYSYLYPNPGDNNYTSGTYSYALNSSTRGYWKSQWSGYNRIFFNPQAVYQPWPGQSYHPGIGDLKAVRSNPIHDGWYVNLTQEYLNVGRFSVVVDAEMQGSGFTRSSYGWTGLSYSTAQNGYYYYTSGSIPSDQPPAWARWTPSLPRAGQYEVQLWWREYPDRVTDICYTIEHDGVADSICGVNQQIAPPDGWYSLGTFQFSGSGDEYVELVALVAGASKYAADAVRFVEAGEAVSIRYAHYYTWDDADGNGRLDDGEGVYLVNFVWNDDGDDLVEEGEIERRYYRLYDAGTIGKVETGELEPVSSGSVPDSVKARFYDEGGGAGAFKTPEEDLQNFINWFSFYRRRELTAKAAVANSIVDLEWVMVGFYTINWDGKGTSDPHDDFGVRIPVMPIKVDMPLSTIVDNKDTGAYQEYGSWAESGASGEFRGSSRYTNTTGNWARWTPNITAPGQYNVYVWYTYYSTRDTKALYTVHHNGADSTKVVNQRVDAGQWTLLGTYYFSGDGTEYVKVTRQGSGGDYGNSTSADAVMVQSVDASENVDELNTLLGHLYRIDSSGHTPLRLALDAVGKYYRKDVDSPLGDSPYAADNTAGPEGDQGGGCQHAFAIVMTDGFWNGNSPNVGNQDGGFPAPYGDSFSDTLADVAMKYYKTDLAPPSGPPPDGNDAVPTSSCDTAHWQHMVTYTVSFGAPGSIDPRDINGNGIPDAEEDGVTSYYEDPCFLNDSTPKPQWTDPTVDCYACPYKIDDLWHAAVNGRGIFFSASDPQELVVSLKAIIENMAARTSSGASVSVNGEELNEGSMLYLARYVAGTWEGEVVAYPLDPDTGAVIKTGPTYAARGWNSGEELGALSWDQRSILTYDGAGSGIPFRYNLLTDSQKAALDPYWEEDTNSPTRVRNIVEYLRGRTGIPGFRFRNRILGDIVHSAPLLVRGPIADQDGVDNNQDGVVDEPGEREPGTIFAGGNDGMLHAFNAKDGRERFAYVPNILFREKLLFNEPELYPERSGSTESVEVSKLRALPLSGYNSRHQFYVDMTPYAREIYYPDTGETKILLIGGLGKGGRGYYALDVTNAVDVTAGNSETGIADMVLWEYPDARFDGVDNDGDGSIDEAGEAYAPWQTDPDMGYTYSRAFTVKTHYRVNGVPQWAVFFGNGYNSDNGEAVLYVVFLDQETLKIDRVQKILTGPVGFGCNGLSTPLLVDVDGDFLLDYIYAGDLLGNLWKFDLTDPDPDNWGPAFSDGDVPMPLFQAGGQDRAETSPCGLTGAAYPQAITTKPTAMRHCMYPKKQGYMVLFGTGRYLGDDDLDPAFFKTETIYGVWDYGDGDPEAYLGSFDRETGRLSNLQDRNEVTLLQQVQVDWQTVPGHDLRTLSNHQPNWAEFPEPGGTDAAHVGWYFDLPGFGPYTCPRDPDVVKGERVVKDYVVRDGALIILSIVPNTDRCSGGGNTMVHEMDACTGGRTKDPRFDITHDTKIDEDDLVTIQEDGETIRVAPTGITYPGILHPPVMVRLPDKPVELKVFSTSAGETVHLKEVAERRGIYFWRDIR